MSPASPGNGPVKSTAKQSLKATFILFVSIVTGIFIFMIIAMLIGQTRGPLAPELNKYHTLITIGMAVIAFASLLLARQLLNKGLTAAKNSINTLTEKLNMHRTALIKYLLICETTVFLSIIAYMLTGNFIFQIYAAVFIGFMLTAMPTRKRIVDDLQLGSQEQQELE